MDCNQESQARIERRARTKRGSKIIIVRISLSAPQINPDTEFPMEENLIDISFLAVSGLRRASRII